MQSNFSPSLIYYFLQAFNMYKAMVWFSSIKAKINGILLDEDFLRNNVFQQMGNQEDESVVLQIYKPLKYQDKISHEIRIGFMHINLPRWHPMIEESNSLNSKYLEGICLQSRDLKYMWDMSGGKLKHQFNTDYVALYPNLKRSELKGRISHQALLLSKFIKYQSITYLSDLRRDVEKEFSSQKLSINVNYEVALDMARELNDFWFIYTHFKNKWNTKYKTKPNIPHDTIQKKIKIDQFTLSWNLSCSRYISFSFTDLRSEDEFFEIDKKKYVSAQGKSRMVLKCSFAEAVHFKLQSETIDEFYRCCFVPIENQMICGNNNGLQNIEMEPDGVKDIILSVDEMEMHYDKTPEIWELKFYGQRAHLILPDKYHFCAVIYEMQKQFYHTRRYFKSHIDQTIRNSGFQFKKWKCAVHPDIDHLGERSADNPLRAITVSIRVSEPLFEIEENKLNKVFIDKSEIVEILQEKQYTRVKQRPFQKLWEWIQELNLNNKYVFAKGKKFFLQFELPRELRDKAQVIDLVKSLDEGRQFITNSTFESFKPSVITFKLDYGYLMARNLQKPLAEVWKLNFQLTFIVANLNPIQNLEVFTTTITEKVFQRFGLKQQFNRLLPKQYYDAQLDIYKLKVNMQGQQSFLFFNNLFQQCISKFVWEDISRGRDMKKKYLKYLMSIDRQRARLHGRSRLSILSLQIAAFSKRNFFQNDPHFMFMFSDFVYSQVFQKQQICLRDFIIKKEPLEQFETLFVKLPIIELMYQVDYNEGETLNHFFNQQNVETEEDWLERVQKFMSKSQSVQIKINIPTLGHTNDTQNKCLFMPLLMQSYAENSPIPLIHYQRSHMQFFDEFMKEFQANRIDISGKVYRKIQFSKIGQNPRYTLNFLPQQLKKSKTKFQGFVNDFIFIISDFKDSVEGKRYSGEAEFLGGEQFIAPEEIQDHSKKDQYLRRYNGIIVTNENLVVQSEFTYRPYDINYFEINDSLISTNLFRLSRLTSKNLFKIRHPSFNQQRMMQFDKSLDNFSRFCSFFNLDENKTLKSNQEEVKKKFPQYKIPPVELLEPSMAIFDNCFYHRGMGQFQERNQRFDSELKYRQLLGSFKTLFPQYILTNDQISNQIQKQQNVQSNAYQASSPGGGFQELIDEFVFSENDTIGTVLLTEYRQDQKICYKSMKQESGQRGKEGNGADKSQSFKNKSGPEGDLIHVKHLIEIRGVRLLYTKKIIELIHHHFIKGFDFQQFKKARPTEQGDERNIFLEFDNEQAGRRKGNLNAESAKNQQTDSRILNFRALKKEALVVLRLEQAQVNFQDSLTESQMLIASPVPVVLVIFAYYKNQAPSLLQNEQLLYLRRSTQRNNQSVRPEEEVQDEFENELKNWLKELESQAIDENQKKKILSLKQSIQKREGIQRGFYKDPLNRDTLSFIATTATYTGYQFSSNKNVIKYEMEIQVREMDVYVAPTFINLENPTFWINQVSIGRPGFGPDNFLDSYNQYDVRVEGENLLRKILFVSDIFFNFGFLKEDFVDNFNPSLDLKIIVERLEGSMNGAEWWRFYQVVEQIIMSRGEKAAEVILIENRRSREMQRMKTEFIRDIINSKLKNQYKEQSNEMKPDIAKRISYAINSCNLKLFNQNKQFSGLDINGVHFNVLIYSNRESKQDLDIERITIENLLDGGNYRWVLYPGANSQHPAHGRMRVAPRTMIQCRMKDKFVVVSEAPWKVYDQLEFDVFPSSIQLTRNLYLQFKIFLFDQYYSNRKQSMKSSISKGEPSQNLIEEQEKKYNLLVPTKKKEPKKKKSFQNFIAQQQHQAILEEMQSQDSKSSGIGGLSGQSSHNSDGKKMAFQTARPSALDPKLNILVGDQPKKNQNDGSKQNIFQSLATQRASYADNTILQQATSQMRGKNVQPIKKLVAQDFPVFFKYFRMNEINMTITYYHEKNSFLNTQDLRIRLKPFISHYKFLPFKKMFDNYESHTKKNFINQIPNILKQKLLKAKQKVDEVAHVGVTNSLIEGVVRVKDLTMGQILVQQNRKRKKDKKLKKKIQRANMSGGTGEGAEIDQNSPHFQQQSHQQLDSGTDDSLTSSDSEQELDDEARQAKQKYLQEIKETKLREARNILFGEFAVI